MGRQHNVQIPGQAARTIQDVTTEVGNASLVGIGSPEVKIDIEGRDVMLNDIILSAFETSALSLPEWNELQPAQRDGLIAAKRSEMAQQFRDAGDLPDQDAARAAAQAAVARRQASRESQPGVSAAERAPGLPHRSEIDPKKIVAPVLTQQGWVVHEPKPIPRNFQ